MPEDNSLPPELKAIQENLAKGEEFVLMELHGEDAQALLEVLKKMPSEADDPSATK